MTIVLAVLSLYRGQNDTSLFLMTGPFIEKAFIDLSWETPPVSRMVDNWPSLTLFLVNLLLCTETEE